jgi:hypothetical protein
MMFVYLGGMGLPMKRFAAPAFSIDRWHHRPCFQVKLLHRELFGG